MTYTLFDDGRHDPHDDAPERGRSAPWLAVVLITAFAITLAGVFPFRQILAQDRQVDAARQKLSALIVENEALATEIDALQTPTEIERLAREELGLVRPGEVGYAVEPGEGPVVIDEPVESIVSDDRTIVDKVWDFLTGRDLEPDG